MTTTSTNPTITYQIDPPHTNVEFVVRHMMISKVRGRFAGVSGTISLAEDATVPAGVSVEIDARSITTSQEQRDGHLKSADFFDVATHPTISFVSTKIEPAGESFKLTGDLTMHGTTAPVELTATFGGRQKDPMGKERVGFEAHGKLSRKAYGLAFNIPLDGGGVAIGDEITLDIAVEGVRPA